MLTNNELKLFSSLKLKKFRDKEKIFLIEGIHLIEECLGSDYKIDCILISEKVKSQNNLSFSSILEKYEGPVHYIKIQNFKKLYQTENSQGIIAVVNEKSSLALDAASVDSIIVLDGINDPGNLGTIIRTAYWFDIRYIILSKGSVELHNPKVIRSTQGAFFYMNIYENGNVIEELAKFESLGFNILLFDPKAKNDLKNTSFSNKNVFVFGNEASGISESVQSLPYKKIKINRYSECESLNVAVSCGIVLSHYKFSIKDIMK